LREVEGVKRKANFCTARGWIYQFYSLPEVLARAIEPLDFQIENSTGFGCAIIADLFLMASGLTTVHE
jgi:hypothetical protein